MNMAAASPFMVWSTLKINCHWAAVGDQGFSQFLCGAKSEKFRGKCGGFQGTVSP